MQIGGLYNEGYVVSYNEGDEALFRDDLEYSATIDDDYHTIKDGETLLSIAKDKYQGQDKYWYAIADVNPSIEDIFDLEVGKIILIPKLDNLI